MRLGKLLMLALIDLDPLPYAYGGLTYEDGTPLSDSMLRKMVDDKITNIVDRSGATDWVGYLTDSASNFRIRVATILPYKGNRSGNPKPARYQMLRDYLLATYPDRVQLVVGMEADDQLAIDQWRWVNNHEGCARHTSTYPAPDYYEDTTIICTIDKDLEMVPGWHYKWGKGNTEETPPFFVTQVEGLRFFYKQLLTGDMTDNILGLYGVGKKSTLLSKLDDMDSEEAMFLHVYGEYKSRFGAYADQFMLENGRLLWMLREEGELWEFPEITIEEEEECF
jgi:hypothetical protein